MLGLPWAGTLPTALHMHPPWLPTAFSSLRRGTGALARGTGGGSRRSCGRRHQSAVWVRNCRPGPGAAPWREGKRSGRRYPPVRAAARPARGGSVDRRRWSPLRVLQASRSGLGRGMGRGVLTPRCTAVEAQLEERFPNRFRFPVPPLEDGGWQKRSKSSAVRAGAHPVPGVLVAGSAILGFWETSM